MHALAAFQNCVSHFAGQQFYGADSVVVSGDYMVDFVGIAVGVNGCNDRNVQLVSFQNSDVLLACLSPPHGHVGC